MPIRLGLGAATGITLALVRRRRLLCWSAVGIVFVLMRSIRRSAAPDAVAIACARPQADCAWPRSHFRLPRIRVPDRHSRNPQQTRQKQVLWSCFVDQAQPLPVHLGMRIVRGTCYTACLLGSLQAQLRKQFRVFHHNAAVGLKVFNITNHFNPRDYQATSRALPSAPSRTAWVRTFRGKWVFEFKQGSTRCQSGSPSHSESESSQHSRRPSGAAARRASQNCISIADSLVVQECDT